ncbi:MULTISPECIES: hypothetical protein [Sphingobium]|nr:hypothetical protein [Sphingobium sp. 15-1]
MTSLVKRAFCVFHRRRHIRQRLEQIRHERCSSGTSAFTVIM